MIHESEWQTRKKRSDTRLRALGWEIVPFSPRHFAEFEAAYGQDPNGLSNRTGTGESGRFRKFHISEIKERAFKLDITWLKDESLENSDELLEPQDLATEAITELEAVVDDLRDIVELLEREEGVER